VFQDPALIVGIPRIPKVLHIHPHFCSALFQVFDELRPVLDFSSEILVTQNLPNSCALVAFQVAIAISCCQAASQPVMTSAFNAVQVFQRCLFGDMMT